MKKIIIYTMDQCPFCQNAKSLLKTRGIPFQEIRLAMDDEEAWKEAEKRSGMKSVPQIFADGILIGGYQELAALDAKDRLQSLGSPDV